MKKPTITPLTIIKCDGKPVTILSSPITEVYSETLTGASEVLKDFLYIGCFADLLAITKAKTDYTHILSIMDDYELPEISKDIKHLHIEISDNSDSKIGDHLDRCIEFINKARDENGKILVHCRMGISRSATVVICYLVKMGHDMNSDKAYDHVHKARSEINPNLGFQLAIEAYCASIVQKP
jgi:predicted protein tyrosine phosphatase